MPRRSRRFNQVSAHLESMGLRQAVDDAAIQRYVEAESMAATLRRSWENLGSPVTELGGATGRAVMVHPLVPAIQNAERAAAELGARCLLDPATRVRLKKDKPAEESPQAQVRRGIGASPAQKLRSVG